MEHKKDCIFCKIAKKEISSTIIYEDAMCIAIPDKFPSTEGQSLIIPKIHEPYIFNLNEEIYTHIFLTAKKIGNAIDRTFNSQRTCIVVEGFDIPHVHIRLHPTYGHGYKINGKESSNEEMEKISNMIKKAI